MLNYYQIFLKIYSSQSISWACQSFIYSQSSFEFSVKYIFQVFSPKKQATAISIICTIFLNQCVLYNQKREFTILYYQMSQIYEHISNYIRTIQPSFQFHSNDLIYCLNAVTELVKLHPRKAGLHFQELLNILSKMLNEPHHFNLENYADFYEVIIESFCSLPQFSKSNNALVSQILRGAILVLGNISIEVTTEWSHPIDSMIGEDSIYSNQFQLRICKEIMENIDSLASQIGYQIIRANFIPIFKEYLQFNNNWRFKYGALLVASQIGEGAQSINDVRVYVQKAIVQLRSNEPKVKFAALQLIGQYSCQLKPMFQQQYFEIIVPQLLKQLMNDLPRIASHAFASLSNFFAQFDEFWKIQNILHDLLPPMLHYLKTGTAFMQQCALQTLFSLASVRNSLGSNLNLLIQVCGELIQKCIRETAQTEVLQQTFETLSLLLTKQDKRSVQHLIPHFIESLLLHRGKISDHSFLACWSHLCLQYDAFINIDSPHFVENLLSAVDREVEEGTQTSAIISLDCLCHTFKSFTWRMRPYLQDIFKFGKEIYNNSDNFQTIRSKAIEVIVDLLVSIRTQEVRQQDIFLNTAMSILQFLVEQGVKCILPNGDMNLLIGILKGINTIIPQIGPSLDRNYIVNISSKLILFKQKMQEIFINNPSNQDQNQYEDVNSDEEVQHVEECQEVEQIEDLEEVMDIIPDIYENLIKVSNASEKIMLIEDMIPQISFAATKTDQWKLFALNLALALVQSCSYQHLTQYWPNLMQLFNSFTDHGNSRLRNQGVYGMGLVFLKTPIELISQQNVLSWMQTLWKSKSAPFDKDMDKGSIDYCKDNIISALGKLIKSYGSHLPHLINPDICQRWIESLPLKHDQLERDCQQQILIELLNQNPSVIIHDLNDLKRICQIFAAYTILCIQQKKNSTLKKTKQFFCHMKGWDVFQRSSEYLWNSLSTNQQTAISKLMTYE